MSQDAYFYEPKHGHGLPHDPFKSIIAPRPIGWISSQDQNGVRNLAPYSFFNAFCAAPPIIGFASAGWKDSVRNIEATGEFCWNLSTRSLAAAMNTSCDAVDAAVDEFELAGLTPAASSVISAPRVQEAPVSFECRLTQLLRLETADGTAVDTWLVMGEVVGVHIDPALLEEGIYQTAAAEPIMRAGGPTTYYTISDNERFDMARPGAAPGG
ncbi:flavin reductase family protein [Larsenimonas suaedae]|uniref:Flavin reductase family protein n=1 Tax=Larsenimonas suaedae TaxID=1851019 RepID=A0ABU1GSM3_9GAMM|nr:flavin reductase family protein [Larsenimonas suaedae]MCM2972696.1 flavin reductase family protein [Larsenimonas suaedae]MDR5894507.1 flavin reductase family protein [Larsenimonas suaedae]